MENKGIIVKVLSIIPGTPTKRISFIASGNSRMISKLYEKYKQAEEKAGSFKSNLDKAR